jgi:hypothetical protein
MPNWSVAEAQSRNNEMNREMRRKERAERELKQLKGDIANKVNIHTGEGAQAAQGGHC